MKQKKPTQKSPIKLSSLRILQLAPICDVFYATLKGLHDTLNPLKKHCIDCFLKDEKIEKLSHHWGLMQGYLFPNLEKVEELCPKTDRHRRLVYVLEFVRVENFIGYFEGHVGRPEKDRQAIARVFIAKSMN